MPVSRFSGNDSAFQFLPGRICFRIDSRTADQLVKVAPQKYCEILCDRVQRLDAAMWQIAGQQTRIALVAVHQLNVRSSGFFVSHEEPENRHSVSGFLNETVDIFLAIWFLCGSRLVNIETSDPSLASTNTTNLSWLEGNVNLRGTFHRTGQLRAGYPFGIAGGQHSCTA